MNTEKYSLVPARPEDFSACMEILRAGREFQRAQGFVQWPDNFPDGNVIRADIQNQLGYVVKVDGSIAAYLYLGFDGDPAYPLIRGAWQYDAPYAVIHRIAVSDKFRGIGLTGRIFDMAGALCREHGIFLLRIDTHEDNKRMQHILTKNGFVCCGTVIQSGSDRLAYEKKL